MKNIDENQTRQLLDAVNLRSPFGERDHAMITLVLHTGLRIGELTQLIVHHVAQAGEPRQVLFLPNTIGKGGRSRSIPLNATARGAVAQLLAFNKKRGFSTAPAAPLLFNRKHRPLSIRSVQKIVERLREKAGLDIPATPHSLRHSFATMVMENTGNLRVTQKLCGHARLTSTQVYTHPDLGLLTRAVATIG